MYYYCIITLLILNSYLLSPLFRYYILYISHYYWLVFIRTINTSFKPSTFFIILPINHANSYLIYYTFPLIAIFPSHNTCTYITIIMFLLKKKTNKRLYFIWEIKYLQLLNIWMLSHYNEFICPFIVFHML